MDDRNLMILRLKGSAVDVARVVVVVVVAAIVSVCQALAQTSYSYSNTTQGGIPDDSDCSDPNIVIRTFDVTDSFIVADLNVGVVIDHTYRQDLVVSLESPTGTRIAIVNQVGAGQDDLNVRLDDEGGNPLGADVQDASQPYPDVVRQPSSALSAFDGEQANGTWTMRVCDTFAADIGAFLQGHLEFTSSSGGGSGGVVTTYSEAFVNGVSYGPGTTQYDNWTSFLANIPSSGLESITIGGSLDPIGFSCTNAPTAQAIGDALRSGGPTTNFSCDGLEWQVYDATGSGFGTWLGAGPPTVATDFCSSDDYVLRPQIQNLNWGGLATDCGAPSQTLTVSYSTTPAADPFVVTNTNSSGAGSLLAAITSANSNPSADTISFNIPTSDPNYLGDHWVIRMNQVMDLNGDGDVIDGTTQPGASCGDLWNGTPHTLRIRIDGNGGTSYDGLHMHGDGQTIRGIAITSYADGISVEPGASNATIQCTYIGVGVTGTPDGNAAEGIDVRGNTVEIGGLTAGEGNVISSNNNGILTHNGSTNISIRGNFIGMDPTGLIARGNSARSINNTDGSSTWNEIRNNLISANGSWGISLDTNDSVSGVSGALVIAGNYIGVNRVATAAFGNIGSGIFFASGSVTGGLTIGGTSASDRNIISGNSDDGIDLQDISDVDILGNYIGVGADGVSDFGNSRDGINLIGGSNITVGGPASGARNVISGNSNIGVDISGASTVSILGNYIGLGADGATSVGNDSHGVYAQSSTGLFIGGTTSGARNVISSNGNSSSEGIWLNNGSTATILGNYIGLDSSGTLDRGNGDEGIVVDNGSAAAIGDGSTVGRNIIAGNGGASIYVVTPGSSADINNNYLGLGVGGQTFIDGEDGVQFNGGSSGTVRNNSIYGHARNGVRLSSSFDQAAIYSNNIYGNSGIGINLNAGTEDANNVTANDSGDGDTGPNDLLNYPVINSIGSFGNTTVTYDFNLDVPSNANGYRVEFFKNSSADPSGYGEGEIYLGGVEVAHGGGDLNFTGNFIANATVNPGDIISATTTRLSSPSTYDVTSEFALNGVTANPLIVTDIADTSTLGTLRYALEQANALPDADNVSFNVAGSGPHTVTISSPLPTISDDNVSIDGTTQTGAVCGDLWAGIPHTLMMEIVGNTASAITVAADGVSIRGLAIAGANRKVEFGSPSSNSSVTCSFLGLRADGSAGGGNQGALISGIDNVIGGPGAIDGNVISGNTFNGVVVLDGAVSATIEGNFVGTDPTGGSSTANGLHGIGNFNFASTASINAIRRNLVSGNTGNGIHFTQDMSASGSSGDVLVVGNHVGVDRTGSNPLANGGDGFNFAPDAISDVTIGGASAADRNVISGNTGNGVYLSGVDSINLLGNYIGLGADGVSPTGNGLDGVFVNQNSSIVAIGGTASGAGNVISGNGDDGIDVPGASLVSVLGNFIGTDATGTVSAGNLDEGVVIRNSVTSVSVGDGTEPGRNVISGNGSANILVRDGASSTVDANLIGSGVGGEPLGGGLGLQFIGSGPSSVLNNTITNSSGDGVFVSGASAVAITGNSISNNAGLGINLSGGSETADGVTANDSGDGDTGANDLLNYPIINSVFVDGTTTVSYDFNLDAPANANGYRVEFFSNAAADNSGFGEGETYLGFAETGSHAGGDLNFSGAFTSATSVSPGDIFSATATRITGSSSFDITSEFSLSYTSSGAPDLQVALTVDVYDPNASNPYTLPENDVVTTLSVTNAGNGAVDAGSIKIVVPVSGDLSFYNGDFDDTGPETAPVVFSETSTGLSFDPIGDLAFSNSPSKPADFSDCTFSPAAGYDPNVTFVCVNLSGGMAFGDPDPSFNLRFRSRID